MLATLRKIRDRLGNGALRKQLGWTEPRYWRAHEFLLDKGKIVKGRDRGGSVGLE